MEIIQTNVASNHNDDFSRQNLIKYIPYAHKNIQWLQMFEKQRAKSNKLRECVNR